MDSENSESKKTAEWVLEFEVGVNKDNLRRVRECLNRNQEPADSLNSVKLGQVISFKLVFQTESSPEIQIFSEMFNSESATGWEFCFEEEEKNRFLEIKFNFRILEETASLFARYYNSSINIQDEKIRKNELEEFLGELLPGPVAKKIAVSENYDEANHFKTAGIGRPHLTVSTINEEGETEPEKLILNPYFGLKQEEGAILDRNRRFFEKALKQLKRFVHGRNDRQRHLPKDPPTIRWNSV